MTGSERETYLAYLKRPKKEKAVVSDQNAVPSADNVLWSSEVVSAAVKDLIQKNTDLRALLSFSNKNLAEASVSLIEARRIICEQQAQLAQSGGILDISMEDIDRLPKEQKDRLMLGLYRVLANALHPDKGGDVELMKRANAAFFEYQQSRK